jgi:hypothetical protein
MKKILVLQITLFFVLLVALVGLFLKTDVYNDVQRKIVEELCLSCVKLEPDTKIEYRFDTADDNNHPDFVLDNLSFGPVILTYRIDFCPGCDELEENLIEVLNISFGPYDVFYKRFLFEGENITFIHINTNQVSEESDFYKSRMVYDTIGDRGNPMIVFVTYGYNHGFIDPSYATLYGLKEENFQKRNLELKNYISESITLYDTHQGAVD